MRFGCLRFFFATLQLFVAAVVLFCCAWVFAKDLFVFCSLFALGVGISVAWLLLSFVLSFACFVDGRLFCCVTCV